jgi:hypothetical protein
LTQKNESDVPCNNIGSGNIEGAGVGPKGEPGAKRVTKNKRKRLRDIISVIGLINNNATKFFKSR